MRKLQSHYSYMSDFSNQLEFCLSEIITDRHLWESNLNFNTNTFPYFRFPTSGRTPEHHSPASRHGRKSWKPEFTVFSFGSNSVGFSTPEKICSPSPPPLPTEPGPPPPPPLCPTSHIPASDENAPPHSIFCTNRPPPGHLLQRLLPFRPSPKQKNFENIQNVRQAERMAFLI